MADYSDVQAELVALATAAIYPNGTGQASVTGFSTFIYQGWPNAQQLNSDLAALNAGTGGRIHVSIFATNVERDVSRYLPTQTVNAVPAHTLTASIAGNTVTIGGAVSTPQNIAINVAGVAYVYAVQASDTLTTIASALSGLIPGATSNGATITITSRIVWARVGSAAGVQVEYGRQARTFMITIWSHSPPARTATAVAIDQALRALPFIMLPDGTQGRLRYKGSPQDDIASRDNVWRRDLNYECEFATIVTTQVAETLVGALAATPGANPALTNPTLPTRYN